jgi:hypothetical protein
LIILEDGWYASGEELMRSQQQLTQLINWRLEGVDRLTFSTDLPQEFIDEHAKVSKRRLL